VCREFADAGVGGHPEIEMALVELYRATGPSTGGAGVEEALTFVPYHLWGNRGPAAMRVWVPEGPVTG
jgi:DUF1680 family protein